MATGNQTTRRNGFLLVDRPFTLFRKPFSPLRFFPEADDAFLVTLRENEIYRSSGPPVPGLLSYAVKEKIKNIRTTAHTRHPDIFLFTNTFVPQIAPLAQVFSSLSAIPGESRLPVATFAPGASSCMFFTASPSPLPPEVQNGTTFLPLKS